MSQPSATDVALQVIQQAVTLLAKWAEVKLPSECNCSPDHPIVQQVKRDILPWGNEAQPQPLSLLFDRVKLEKGQAKDKKYYWQAQAIADEKPPIPYPQTEKPDTEQLRQEVRQALANIKGEDWQNLSLLTLIVEKFGSYISLGDEDVALIDLARSTAAVAAALSQHPDTKCLHLIAGDLSGIQDFIYTISSDGALKSLRARSFYLELITEAIVHQLLEGLGLPRTNVIYAGGGNLYLLASGNAGKVKEELNKIRELFNGWFQNSFKGKIFLAIDYVEVPTAALKTKEIADYWTRINKKLAKWKLRRFENTIAEFIKPTPSYEPCRVCHRDDLPKIKPLKYPFDPDSSPACWMCRIMFDLGEKLFGVEAVVCSKRSNIKGSARRIFIPKAYYYFFKDWEQANAAVRTDDTMLNINNWELERYQHKNTVSLLLGNYGQRIKEESRFIRAEEMAERATGIPRVGYLRMDVDKLGRIFAEGLGAKQTLPRIAGLSRLMSYFFKVYLNSLAEFRQQNFIEARKNTKLLENSKALTESDRPDLLFIYAGGDDLFISGAWNQVVEFAFDAYQCFRAYTGKNPDITLSGGISINEVKFPLYQAAEESGAAEEAAKNNGRDSLGLFNSKFKWEEWLGIEDINIIDKDDRKYLKYEKYPSLWGIFPLVEQLNSKLDINYARSFVRNLLLTAELQEQMLNKIEDKSSEQGKHRQREIRYYLHLPKIVYTLARLPSHVRENDNFVKVRTSLKNPYNAPYFRAIATWIELLNR